MSVITITNENFKSEVMESDKNVLIDFWASCCAPCRMLSPVVDEIAKENPNIKVCKVNIDEQPELAGMFQVQSIPTLVAVKNGRISDFSVGVKPKSEILAMIK